MTTSSNLTATTAARPRFDLRSQPWLPVRTLDGRTEELGLAQVLERAQELHSLTGEVPTQVFALHRLLLALLHRAVDWAEDDPTDAWAAAWRGEVDLASAVGAHLERHADRFDLLHPTAPFFQVAELMTASGGTSPLTSLIADVPNNTPYFTTRAGHSLERISLAEAARWVVNTQAFDPSGIKSGAVGDGRVKGGKGYPIGTAWSGALGGLVLEGRNLRETLLLNLVLTERNGEPWSPQDRAVWERPPQGVTVEAAHGEPLGPADLLTWQSRRVRLVTDGDDVTGVVVANGDPLSPQDRFDLEAMTTWRRSPSQEKAQKRIPVYVPATHEPARALWRGLPAIMPRTALTSRGAGGAPSERLAPGSLDWVATVVHEGHLPADLPVRTRAIGVRYGSQQSVVDEIVDDGLLIHAVLLGEAGSALREEAVRAVGATDQAVQSVVNLAGNLAAAAGGTADGPRERAREQAYDALDAPFREWLRSLTPGADTHARREAWEREVWRDLVALGGELREDAGAPAWVGRPVHERWVDSSLAWDWFLTGLRKALVLAGPRPATTGRREAPPTPRSA